MYILKELFQEQQKAVNHFFDQMDQKATENLLQAMLSCSGIIFFSGIGKSGLIAKKIAVTMTSTGTRSLFLSPSDAVHGDIGIVSAHDFFIFISKSGESEELLHLIPFLRNRNVKIAAIVSDPKSRLAKSSDYPIILPLTKELCPFDLAPTTSSAIQLIFGDILAMALMKHNKFDREQYRMNHPAGRIGKRMVLKVKDLMLKGPYIPCCKAQDKVIDVLVELSNKRCGCLLIVDEAMTLKGIFTDGDLRRALQNKGTEALQIPLEELMTKNPRTIDSELLAYSAMQAMEADQKNPITVLPVIEKDRKVVGLIKMHDILQSGI